MAFKIKSVVLDVFMGQELKMYGDGIMNHSSISFLKSISEQNFPLAYHKTLYSLKLLLVIIGQ